ncbi:hypothetical protein HanXRQr2_Chr13g0603881 [Helianthus annuus]|uniref:Gag-polypeptide of LTR copia-type n=1 Tax=Helianthus annuus TaxID=4232 RepID=A0A251SV67_HELAN|nr:hypothetical protein HanXRQr2_Chr13g0603881 [Helianthus annuus]KAJ0850530.1 hypothetical protein HanPSC8_Chr13g0581911 [Helianthus annuus]
MSLNQLSPIAQAEHETGTTTKPPKLKGAEDFGTWKTRIQSFFEYTDYNLWLSVTAGPHIPTVVRGDAVVANNDATTFTDEDKALIQRDCHAHAALTMALSTNDCNMFEKYRTANELWLALIEYYEGNEELIESKRIMVQKQYDLFCGIRGESLSDHISRFRNMMTKMKKAGNHITNRAAIKKLLDSLTKEWSLKCMMIKRDFLNNPNPVTLTDLINTLKDFEMDVNKREMNTTGYTPKPAQTSAGLKNVALLASEGVSQHASDTTYFNASASASKAPRSNEKTVVLGDTQAKENAEAEEQVHKALMAKISSDSLSSSSKPTEKQATGIPKGDDATDKSMKSILTFSEPEKDKKVEEAVKAIEQVQKETTSVKEEKAKASAVAMKTESSKEKADKDLIQLCVKKMCAMRMGLRWFKNRNRLFRQQLFHC